MGGTKGCIVTAGQIAVVGRGVAFNHRKGREGVQEQAPWLEGVHLEFVQRGRTSRRKEGVPSSPRGRWLVAPCAVPCSAEYRYRYC